jgi:glycosyltransferase involved in cell wall biosynthesis
LDGTPEARALVPDEREIAIVKNLIQTIFERCGVEVHRRRWDRHRDAFVRLTPEGTPRGRVLLAYVIDPFLGNGAEPVPTSHTHFWESLQMARTFLELGYAVDAISYRNDRFQPRERYSLFLSARTNFQRIAELLDPDCIKVAHLDMAHWLFNNSGVLNRALDLQQRRGVTLRSHSRMQEENLAIEHADCATILGNDFTVGTYSYAGKPLYRLPVPSCREYEFPKDKDFEACRGRYLWFGSTGFLHKGLGLALEAFAGMPEYHLTVCGPVHREREFAKAYHAELYEKPNIETVGWVDVESSRFLEVTGSCVALIYPSCSEGMSGSVITCMHAGLIPLVSYESGVDIGDGFGRVLQDCSVDGIRQAVRGLSSIPSQQLGHMARGAWAEARSRYTRTEYAKRFREAMEEILGTYGARERPSRQRALTA